VPLETYLLSTINNFLQPRTGDIRMRVCPFSRESPSMIFKKKELRPPCRHGPRREIVLVRVEARGGLLTPISNVRSLSYAVQCWPRCGFLKRAGGFRCVGLRIPRNACPLRHNSLGFSHGGAKSGCGRIFALDLPC